MLSITQTVMSNTPHVVHTFALYDFHTVSRCPHVTQQTLNGTTVYEVRQFYCW